jgi:hypothetical protein
MGLGRSLSRTLVYHRRRESELDSGRFPCGPRVGRAPRSAPAAPQDAHALLKSFDARSLKIRDFTAKFTQTYRSGALGRAITETGTVKVKRPSRSRSR